MGAARVDPAPFKVAEAPLELLLPVAPGELELELEALDPHAATPAARRIALAYALMRRVVTVTASLIA